MTSGISLQLNFTERTSGQWWSHGGAVAEDLVPSRSRDMMSSATTKCISMGGANCASPVMPTEPWPFLREGGWGKEHEQQSCEASC